MQRVWSVYLGNNGGTSNSTSNSGNRSRRAGPQQQPPLPEDHRLRPIRGQGTTPLIMNSSYHYGNQEQEQLVPENASNDRRRESGYSAMSMFGDNSQSPRTSESTHSSRPILDSTPSPSSSANMNHTNTNTSAGRSRKRSNSYPHQRALHSPPPLDPPLVPFAQHAPGSVGYSAISSREGSPGPSPDDSRTRLALSPSSSTNVPALMGGYGSSGMRSDASNVSLSVNYLPNKFSSGMLAGDGGLARRRKGGKGGNLDPVIPKMGGGVDAFRVGVSRMAGEGDEDEDDGFTGLGGGKSRIGGSRIFGGFSRVGKGKRLRRGQPKKLRWNRFKWILFISNALLTGYSLVSLIVCLLTWFDVWVKADIVRVGNRTELVISTLAASMGIFTSLIGWAGILMNNRSFLAIYTFFLWITFIFLVVPGYLTYKRRSFNIEGKINAQWSRDLGAEGRQRIQNQLNCCGYFSPFVEATISQTCYARSILPGCKSRYLTFEKEVLKRWYTAVFSLVPVHICVMTIGLLCSNHVTYRFGKGMMPKAYRLSMNSMAVIMDSYANQLAERYGSDVASDIIARSRSQTQLDAMPTVSYLPLLDGQEGKAEVFSSKYSATSKAPHGAF